MDVMEGDAKNRVTALTPQSRKSQNGSKVLIRSVSDASIYDSAPA